MCKCYNHYLGDFVTDMIVVYTQDTSIGEMEGEKKRESYWWKPEVVPIYFTRKNTSIKKLCQQKYERIVHEIA